MTTAKPCINPTMMGFDRKSDINPSLKIEAKTQNIPESIVRLATIMAAVPMLLLSNCSRLTAIKMERAALGPTINSFELLNNA